MTDPAQLADLLLAIETEAAAFYDALAGRFSDRPDIRAVWEELAEDEREHATWIRGIRERMGRAALFTGLPKLAAAPLEAVLHEVKQHQERAERGTDTVVEALAAAIALETSEVNDTLADFLTASRPHLPSPPLAQDTLLHLRRLTEAVAN